MPVLLPDKTYPFKAMILQNTLAPAANLVLANQKEDLQHIHLLTKNIAVWDRENPLNEQQCLNLMDTLTKPFSASGSINEIETALEAYCANFGCETALLQKDVQDLLHIFSDVTNAATFKVLLVVVNTNMCRKFHTDINDLRLLCTYYGPGTLWLAEKDATQYDTDNDELYTENAQQVKAGQVAILKGALYPADNVSACVHRSPTVEETGERRLLLRIDTNEFLAFLEK
jgi:hypothetical protein